MIIYKVFHTRMDEHSNMMEFCSEFDSFNQAFYWAKELTKQELPTRWEFEFINAPKQYEFNF